MAKENTELKLRKEALPALTSMLRNEAQLKILQSVLPAGIPAQRIVEQTLSLCISTPGLLECKPISIWDGLKKAAELGLEMSGVLGQAYLVPRWNKAFGCKMATFQLGYRGYTVLAYRSGQVKVFRPETVRENDLFIVQYGTDPKIVHTPAQGERGKIVGYYAVALFVTGGHDFFWMTQEEMNAHRTKYCDEDSFAWKGSPEPMSQKTVMRMLAKRLPVSTALQEAAVADEYHEQGLFPGLPEPSVPMESALDALEKKIVPSAAGQDFEGGPDPSMEQDTAG